MVPPVFGESVLNDIGGSFLQAEAGKGADPGGDAVFLAETLNPVTLKFLYTVLCV